ncbi:CobW family GTP-binding protein [Anaerobacillus alkaliphilus]|uniref:CobW family GTP-binding protein n=1 Tax=Anaerobacillus alkaliphilus TaxID=1548597 RepID=UPI0013757A05|nr:GTP-binding protein [Anaerobacillus alkaliphilus]
MRKIPSYIITGFLGSGKTTILQKILDYCRKKSLKPAIVLNEIGDINVEQGLFQDNQVLEMLNGCICCSIQGDFTRELHSFLLSLDEKDVPDVIFIEGTGIANPLEIVDGLTDPLLIECIDLFSIVNIIDASKYLEYQSIFSSSKEVRSVLKAQVTTSSFIIVNKVDLVTEKVKEKVLKKVTSQKRGETPLVEASYGEVDINQLLEQRFVINRKGEDTCGCSSDHSCDEHIGHHHNHSFQAVKIEVPKPVERIKLEKWLKQLPETIIRGKGIIQLTETVGSFQFQFASKQLHLNRVKELPKIDPCLILIGVDINSSEIRQSFHQEFIK